jgi:chromosome transmission fidelity protein 18
LFGSNHAPRTSSTPFLQDIPEIVTEDDNNPLLEVQNIGLYQRKRRLELDLFGDIYDIEREDVMNAKKMKSEEERDLDMINKIVEARKKYQEQIQPLKTSNLKQLEALHNFKMQNLSYSVPRYFR